MDENHPIQIWALIIFPPNSIDFPNLKGINIKALNNKKALFCDWFKKGKKGLKFPTQLI